MDEELDKILNRKSRFGYTVIDALAQVRLLRVSGGLAFPAVQHSLEVVSLADLPSTQYRALSYTWGHVDGLGDLGKIELGGESFFVRRNLHEFLRTIVAKNEYGLFFIDAICINQLDPDERRLQVKEMAHIYRNAVQVIAWLGFPESNQQLDNVRCLSQVKGQARCAKWTTRHWEAFRYLSYHHYWSRVWVVQEVLLASRMSVWCGFFTFPLSLFAGSSPSVLQRLPEITFSGDENRRPRSIVSSSSRLCSPAEKVVSHRTRQMLRPRVDVLAEGTEVGTLEEMTLVLRSSSSTVVETYQSTVMDPLHEVVRKFGRLGCSDARDKIYGFLGIMNDRARARVNPDYTQDVRFAYYQALKIGLHEIYTEEADLAHFQHPHHVERLFINYYCDARDAFGIDDTDSLSILEHSIGELHHQPNLTTAITEVQSERQFIWRGREIGVLHDSKQLIRSAEPVEPLRTGWLWRFHHRQLQLVEKIYQSESVGKPSRKTS